MANFIDSSKILMYPSAFRAVNPESYLNTEFNLTNTKRLSSYKELNSYVINKDDYYVNFCINGYFFKIKYSDLTGLNLKPLYAYIILKNENSQEDVRVIDRYNNLRLTVVSPKETESTFGVLDINNEFRGLAFTNSLQDIVDLEEEAELNNEFEIHHLQLLDNKGDVVENKFKLSSLEIRNGDNWNESIFEEFSTKNLEVREKLTAKDAEITNDLTVNNGTTTLDVLNVLNNATLEKDLILKGALNGAKISGEAQVTFEQIFNGLNSTIEDSSVSNATIEVVDDSGITLANLLKSKSLNLPFNPSGTGSKVLVNTAGSSSWVTLTNTAAKSSVVYRDAYGDTAVRNLDTTEINAKKIYLKDISFPNDKGEVTYALSLAYDSSNKKNYIKLSNLQKSFSAGVTTNEISDATPTPNNFISSVYVAEDGSMKFSSTGLTAASDTALGAVKIGYTQNGKNYPVALSDEKMYVNVPWVNYYHKAEVDENAGIPISTAIGIDDPLVVPYATKDNYGVVKPADVRASAIATNTLTSKSSRYYGVEMDTNGKLFVNVPWSNSDTTYSAGAGLTLDNSDKFNVNTGFTTVAYSGNSSGKYQVKVDDIDKTNSLYTEIPAATVDGKGYGVVKVGFGDQDDARLYGVQLTTHQTNDSERNRMFVRVPWTDTTYSAATSDTFGLVKIGYTKSGKNYPVELSDGKMYVNVPWTDNDTDTGATSVEVTGSGNAVTSASYSASTRKLTLNKGTTFLTGHRAIKVGGTQMLGTSSSTALNLKAGTNISVSYTSGGDVTYSTIASPEFTSVTLTSTSQSLTASGPISATSFTTTSDIRKKENIEEFKYTKSILDLPIKKFDYIDGPKNQIGCIAQDLQKLYPELVKEDDKGYLSISESKLVYLLIEEVKQLKEELKQVKNDVLFLLN